MDSLAKELAGQKLRVPDLRAKFKSWPQGVNARLEDLRVEVDKMIQGVTDDLEMLDNAERSDMGHLTALWYPNADWTKLNVAAAYLAWVFIWDDEIDLGVTDTAKDQKLGREYCEKSLKYIKGNMGLDSSLPTSHPYRYMQIFEKFGDGLRTTDKAERLRTYEGLKSYVTQVGVEHDRQLAKVLPTPKEYHAMRMGTAGVAPVAGCAEYMNGVRLPDWVRNSLELKILGRESTLLCLIINDLYSAPKEIKCNTFQNYVVVLLNESKTRSLDEAVNRLLEMLDDSMKSFEKAAEELKRKAQHDEVLLKDLTAVIDSHCHFVTGLIEWTLTSSRYKMDRYLQRDGSVIIPLGTEQAGFSLQYVWGLVRPFLSKIYLR